MTKEDVLNQLIEDNSFEKYMEIGYANGTGYNQVKAKYKVAVDPAITEKRDDLYPFASDEFFADHVDKAHVGDGYHIVLVDGLHHADQVRKDIVNASKILSKDGVIVLHDVNPNSEETQSVPCKTPIWEGDCWRAFVGFRKKYPNVKTECYLEDHGIAIIYPEGKKFKAHFEDMETTYVDFEVNKKELLGVK